MAQANPRWGAPRIHGELLKLGIDVCQATVAKYMGRRRQPPSQTWRTFLRNHRPDRGSRFLRRPDPSRTASCSSWSREPRPSPNAGAVATCCNVDWNPAARSFCARQCAASACYASRSRPARFDCMKQLVRADGLEQERIAPLCLCLNPDHRILLTGRDDGRYGPSTPAQVRHQIQAGHAR
jgi:hypothetical protein